MIRTEEPLMDRVRRRAASFFEEAGPSHGWDHVERVLLLCERIGRQEGCDMRILRLAALLHDIGRRDGDEARGELCHARHGAALAEPILREAGLDPAAIEAVVHCIAAHRYRNDVVPESREAKVLFDADKLDSIGAVGIGRAFQFAGEVGARLHDPAVDPQATRPYGPDDTAYREYLVKLRHVRDRMTTATGRALAEGRSRFMQAFFERLDAEVRAEV